MIEDDDKLEVEEGSTEKGIGESSDGVQTKGVSYLPVLTNIFEPTSKLLGTELRDFVKQKIDSFKERRRAENITAHVEAVRQRMEALGEKPSSYNESIEQMDLFVEWVDGAKEVDPNEKTLASMWQELLYQIASGKKPRGILIEKLKSLSSEEAAALIEFKSRRFMSTRDEYTLYNLTKLVEKGLLSKSYIFPFYIVFSVILFISVSLLMIFSPEVAFLIPPINATMDYDMLRSYGVLALMFLFSFIPALFNIVPSLIRWTPTWLGRELLSYVKLDSKPDSK